MIKKSKMSIDDAIQHCLDIYEDKKNTCKKCSNEHKQLADWLLELKKLQNNGVKLSKIKIAKHGIDNRGSAILIIGDKVLEGKNHPELVTKYMNDIQDYESFIKKWVQKIDPNNQKYSKEYIDDLISNAYMTGSLPKEIELNLSEFNRNINNYDIPIAFAHKDGNNIYLETDNLYNLSLNDAVNLLKNKYDKCNIFDDNNNDNDKYIKLASIKTAKPRTKKKEIVLTTKFTFEAVDDNEDQAKDACKRFKHWMKDSFSNWDDSILQYFLYSNKLVQDPEDSKYLLEVHIDKIVKDDSVTIDQRDYFDLQIRNEKKKIEEDNKEEGEDFIKTIDIRKDMNKNKNKDK